MISETWMQAVTRTRPPDREPGPASIRKPSLPHGLQLNTRLCILGFILCLFGGLPVLADEAEENHCPMSLLQNCGVMGNY